MRFSDPLLDDIRRANDIVDVVSAVVKLKRRGKNFIGLCPFHQEKTPSFNVNPEMQIFKCFGCGKGGNVFQFVMETERLTFVEAVRSLAERAGIAIPEEGRDSEDQSETEHLTNALKFAGHLFHDNLTKTDEGRAALEYFHGRGFSSETIVTFGLGYSLNSWDHLLTRATGAGVSRDDLSKAGLLRKREDGSFYDYFRGRAMFPIFNASGRIVAFGARKMRDDDPIQGKYINSPETPLYSKSRVLFGLSHAKEAIRRDDSVLLVEGYADMISLFQAGVENVVASSGTALTEDQLDLLCRYSKNLVLVYDGDSAGSQASIRGIDLALEKDMDVRIVPLPQGEDPDSFVRTHGAKAFRDLVAGSVSFIEFKASEYRRMGLFETPEGKTKAVRSIVQSIGRIADDLKRAFFVKDVAERYGLYESVLWNELERGGRSGRTRDRSRELHAPPSPADGATAARVPQEPPEEDRELPSLEKAILRLFLEARTEAMEYVLANLHEEDLADVRVVAIIQRVLAYIETHGSFDLSSALNEVDDAGLKRLMTDAVMSPYEISPGWSAMEKEIASEDPMKVARDAVLAVRRRALLRAMEDSQRALKEAASAGRDAASLLRNHQELLRALKEVERGSPPSPTSE